MPALWDLILKNVNELLKVKTWKEVSEVFTLIYKEWRHRRKGKIKRSSEGAMLCHGAIPHGNGSGTSVHSQADLVAMATPIIGMDHIIQESVSANLDNIDNQGPSPPDNQGPAPADNQGHAPADNQGHAPTDNQGPAPADNQGPAPADNQGPAPADNQGPAPADNQSPAPADNQDPAPAPRKIGRNNTFEIDCKVHAKSIGDFNLFEENCFVGPDVEITNGCVIGAGTKVFSAKKIRADTIIVGRHQSTIDYKPKPKPDDFSRQCSEMRLMINGYPNEFNAFLCGNHFCVEFNIDIRVKKPTSVISDCNPILPGLVLRFLPPICLEVYIPQDYPSQRCPDFIISSRWLAKNKLDRLASEMLSLWERHRSEMLFMWCSLLENSLVFLGIADQDTYDLNEKYLTSFGNPNKVIDPRECLEEVDSMIGNIATSSNVVRSHEQPQTSGNRGKYIGILERQSHERKIYNKESAQNMISYFHQYDLLRPLYKRVITEDLDEDFRELLQAGMLEEEEI